VLPPVVPAVVAAAEYVHVVDVHVPAVADLAGLEAKAALPHSVVEIEIFFVPPPAVVLGRPAFPTSHRSCRGREKGGDEEGKLLSPMMKTAIRFPVAWREWPIILPDSLPDLRLLRAWDSSAEALLLERKKYDSRLPAAAAKVATIPPLVFARISAMMLKATRQRIPLLGTETMATPGHHSFFVEIAVAVVPATPS